jgi:hypothetical protein
VKPVQASTYTFRDIIHGGYLYVDKTRYLYELIRYPKGFYFLARPRRFGKSLMVSTLEEIFHGHRDLFTDLWIDGSDYAWEAYPVIRIDFSRHQIRTVSDLELRIQRHVQQIAKQYNVVVDDGPFDIQVEDLILKLAVERQVVILIDEYDKPIIDNLSNLPEALRIRDTLRSFYGIIKSMDQYLRFVFITGISKFSKVGVFSQMNNLDDLTMDARFATALGITEEELRTDFADHIAQLAEKMQLTSDTLLAQIRQWYDGFCFVEGCPSLYNPFSTLQLFIKQTFNSYWFESGTPAFLIRLLQERQYNIEQLDQLELAATGFNTFELDKLEIIPLLFQTGYLTIKSYTPERRLYTLGYPNFEVESAFLANLLSAFSTTSTGLNEGYLWKLVDALKAKSLSEFFDTLGVFFADIPYDLHIAREKYYQTIFYLIFRMMGVLTEVEVKTNVGRIDAVVALPDQIYLFEFKLDKSADEALQQILDMNYTDKYRLRGTPIALVGANFDSDKRTVADWKTLQITAN